MNEKMHPLKRAALQSGKKPKFLESSVRGKDLKNRTHNDLGTRLRFMNVNNNLAPSERVPLEIDGKQKFIEVFRAIQDHPVELYSLISSKKNPYYINRSSYKILMERLEEQIPGFQKPKSKSQSAQAKKRILARLQENPDLKGISHNYIYSIN